MRSIGFVQFKVVFFLKDTFDLLALERQFLLISPMERSETECENKGTKERFETETEKIKVAAKWIC